MTSIMLSSIKLFRIIISQSSCLGSITSIIISKLFRIYDVDNNRRIYDLDTNRDM